MLYRNAEGRTNDAAARRVAGRSLSEKLISSVAVGIFLAFGACSPDVSSPVTSSTGAPNASPRVTMTADGQGVPERPIAANSARENSSVFAAAIASGGLVRVGIKDSGATRGIWHGKVLVQPAQVSAAVKRIAAIEGAEIVKQDPILPAYTVRIGSRATLDALKADANVDYVVPTSIPESDFSLMSDPGCPAPSSWAGSPLMPAPVGGGDLMSSGLQELRVDRAWRYGASGGLVTIGYVDTGVDESGQWPELTGMYGRLTALAPNEGSSCSHGNRMISVSARPANGLGSSLL